jgi:hypothetical protein
MLPSSLNVVTFLECRAKLAVAFDSHNAKPFVKTISNSGGGS